MSLSNQVSEETQNLRSHHDESESLDSSHPTDRKSALRIRTAQQGDLVLISSFARANLQVERLDSKETERFIEELADPSSFFEIHYPAGNFCWFWIAESLDCTHDSIIVNSMRIIGWIGLQRKSADVGEITRFEIRPDLPSKGRIAASHALMHELISIARGQGVLQLFLGASVVAN